MHDLVDKAILITGASTGIGAAAARAFARAGSRVAVHYNANRKAAEEVAASIEERGGSAVLVGGDLSAPEAGPRIVEQAVAGLGRLDVVVNNAGAILERRPIAELDLDLYRAALDLNVFSVIAVSQAALPHMQRQGGGAIINVGSVAGSDGGGRGSGHYACAKAYVHNLTRHMARDWASAGIRVNAIAPGVIDTPFHAATPPERMEALRNAVAMGRVGTPEDCAGPLLFLASNALSGYVTGQVIHVNGGQYMP